MGSSHPADLFTSDPGSWIAALLIFILYLLKKKMYSLLKTSFVQEEHSYKLEIQEFVANCSLIYSL